MSRVQLGLNQNFSYWLRRLFQSKTLTDKFSKLKDLNFGDIRLFIPSVANRTTGLSMGEHSEITTKRLQIDRERQDKIALKSHQNYIKGKNNRLIELNFYSIRHVISGRQYNVSHKLMTVSRYVRQLKMNETTNPLEHSDLNISEVVSAIGPNSLGYFLKRLREECGEGPRYFRKRGRKGTRI